MQYRILGPLAVAKDGSEVVMGSGKQRALLVLLLLHATVFGDSALLGTTVPAPSARHLIAVRDRPGDPHGVA